MIDEAERSQATSMAERLREFAQPQRIMILKLLLGGERSVSEIGAATGIGQPTLSQQLSGLRRANLVRTRREAKAIFYDLADDLVSTRVRMLFAALDEAPSPILPLDPGAGRLATARPRVDGAANFARIDN